MPRVYVQTLGQFDWLNQEKNSLLNIPGSYWLYYKKNIYKFIFKYHRTVKNTMQFSYGRELLKIVKKIIKCHPSQGQQFGTSHLLVTYNCTSWTRQDKMFAILKFQQRTIATFSHAFVLTIRICPSLEHSLFSLKYPIVKEIDEGKVSPRRKNTIYQNKKEQISKKNAIEDTTKVSNFQDNIVKRSKDKNLNATTTVEMHFNNIEIQDNKSRFINCNIERNIDQHSDQSLRMTKKTNKIPIEKIHNRDEETKSIAVHKPNQEIQNIRKYKIFSSLKSGIMKNDVNNWTLSNGFGFYESSMEKNFYPSNNKDILDDSGKIISETIVNSDDVPNQYFIEKDIEYNKRLNTSSVINQPMQKVFQTEIKNIKHSTLEMTKKNNNEFIQAKLKKYYNKITDLKSQENNEQHTTALINTDNNLSANNTYNKSYKIHKHKREFEKKTISDKVLRSSNITDLVMEGLMFTIRQDQDSIAVIEQKTKLEMDEVLENSEKVETKTGEKCLLNSSLLKLENLVTMIDSPRELEQQHKTTCNTICNNLSPFNIFSNNTVYNLNVNSIDEKIDKSNIFTSYDKHNIIDYLNPCKSQSQHKYISPNIKNNSSCSTKEMITKRSEQLIEHQDEHNRKSRNNIEIEKKKKDFIPQIFQPILFSSEEKNTKLQNKNLQTDNIDIEKISKFEKSVKRTCNSPLSSSLSNPNKIFTKKENPIISEESSSIKFSGQEANSPRIVSDKAITIEQIPLPLQKVLQHTCRTHQHFSTSNNEMLQYEQKMQHVALTENAISKTAISYMGNNINSNIMNNLSVKLTVDSEEIKSYKNESCITINVSKTNEDTCMKNTKKKNNESNHTSRKSSSSKNNLPRKLQDITEDFYYDLLHVHNKSNAIRQRQRSLDNPDIVKNSKVHVEMLKFIQDITEGARVVVRRLNINNKSKLLKKSSTSATHMH